jgi:hypothetical protein
MKNISLEKGKKKPSKPDEPLKLALISKIHNP